MKEEKFQPSVNSTQEFIEIAYDFSNALDLVREAISNAFDAKAKEIEILFSVIDDCGEDVLKIELNDNGLGMNMKGLHSFFDLGNSLSCGDNKKIGEKGHGTKVYLNSSKIIVETQTDKKHYIAVMNEPKRTLNSRKLPEIKVEIEDVDKEDTWTKITILGYNNNRLAKFTHDNLKDYILWFTKMGSIENVFGIEENKDVILHLKGIDHDEVETINFGHIFPSESPKVDTLFSTYMVEAPKYYCKKIVKTGVLKNKPQIKFQAVFYIEGSRVKYQYNKMIKHPGYTPPTGAYTIQERYGLWLCKDFIPIQRKNEWITKKGSEYTKFHAFINCQGLRLTANRGSVENTPSEVLEDLQAVVEEIYADIIESDDWTNIDWLEHEVDAYNTDKKEKKDFKKRLEIVNSAKIAKYKDLVLVEPKQENGVYSMFLQLAQLEKDLFPFTIIDYNTHSGIDVIVKNNDSAPVISSNLFYVEFKNYLENKFNHSFENLHSIVCWDINTKQLKHNSEVIDVAREVRTLQIIPPNPNVKGDYTHYFLDNIRGSKKIEVIVLKTYLQEKLGIQFTARTGEDCF